MSKTDEASSIWGGRFSGGPDKLLEAINASIGFDQKLFRQDIRGSRAHALMLAEQAILSKEDQRAIDQGLVEIEGEIEAGTFTFSTALEDIHMNIETALREKIGAAAGRLHTARSRNDQVATDLRLFVRDELDRLDALLVHYQQTLARVAEAHAATLMPGFTHVQAAQPITFGHHLLAYVEMADRDRGRLADARKRLNECPLGAAALAGTAFPIDRQNTAKRLGFDGPTRNSLDSVSSRDFVLEVLSALAIAGTNLSRLAEELVYWSSPGFAFVTLSDAFTTGSSIMPQKRNPDAAELVRGKVGRLLGSFQALATVIKGLPLAYAKDLQEDKEPVFDALVNFELMLLAMAGMVSDLKVNKTQMAEMAGVGFSTATDLADWLVRELDLPFRDAHHLTGRLVAIAEAKGCALDALPLETFQQENKAIHAGIFDVLSVEKSVASRTSFGGTAPELVTAAAQAWLTKLE